MTLDRNTSVLFAYLCGMTRRPRGLRQVWRMALGYSLRDIFGRIVIEDAPLAANGGGQ
jgi:hypothetical protein